MSIKHELQSIISGDGSVSNGEIIQTIASYLRRKKEAISGTTESEFNKEQETQILITHIDSNGLWYNDLDESRYIGEGAEQRIYECIDPNFVLKLNDGIFYALWEDYFYSLLIHNYFFSHLAYELLGFHKTAECLYAVVKQPYVRSTEHTDLAHVQEFLFSNGFLSKKENDYYHPQLGLILEDLHDQNVLTKDGTLQFIDTVFFLMPSFFD